MVLGSKCAEWNKTHYLIQFHQYGFESHGDTERNEGAIAFNGRKPILEAAHNELKTNVGDIAYRKLIGRLKIRFKLVGLLTYQPIFFYLIG